MARAGDEEHDGTRVLRQAAQAQLVAELVARRQRSELRPGDVREAAARVGVGERTLWRWIAAGRPLKRGRQSSQRLDLTAELRNAYLRLGGNVAAVWREARDRGQEPPPLRTLQAAFARELSPAERASARRGESGRREHRLYLRYEAPHRNAVWQADHKQLPLLIVPPGRRRGRRPWVTLFLDDYSRAITGWAISLQPSSAEVLAALRDAILVDPSRGPFGGIPGRLRWDHGLEFAATAVEQAALALGIDVAPATPYALHEKGKIERLHGTIADGFVAGLPGWTEGPRDQRGRLEAAGEPLELAELVARFDAWVRTYNAERAHRSLGRRTPLERWTGDPTPLRLIAPEDARRLLTARRWARVRRDGVHRGGLAYTAVELTELVGDDVELAFAPHDQRSVEIYWRGAWLCTAKPHDALSRAEQRQILAERRAYAGELRRRQRRSAAGRHAAGAGHERRAGARGSHAPAGAHPCLARTWKARRAGTASGRPHRSAAAERWSTAHQAVNRRWRGTSLTWSAPRRSRPSRICSPSARSPTPLTRARWRSCTATPAWARPSPSRTRSPPPTCRCCGSRSPHARRPD
jgi:putative transposase